jgi:hypothetical protein
MTPHFHNLQPTGIMIATTRFLRLATRQQFTTGPSTNTARCFSFSFVGPKKLEEILKKTLVGDKSRSEVADLWYTYHEEKEHVHGLVLKGEESQSLLSRAASR